MKYFNTLIKLNSITYNKNCDKFILNSNFIFLYFTDNYYIILLIKLNA